MTEEEEFEFRNRLEQERAVSPIADNPYIVEEKPERPGFLKRSRDALALGASDAAHSFMGNTYGRSGDDTTRDDLSPAGRTQQALFGDVAGSVGQVAGDAIMSMGRNVLPQAVQDTIGDAYTAASESPPAQALSGGLDKWKSAHPDSYMAAGEVLNMALPKAKFKPKPKFGENARLKLARQNEAVRKKEVGHLIEPDAGKGHGDFHEAPGMMQRKEYHPSTKEKARLDTVAAVDDVDPRRSYTHNKDAIQNEVYEIDEALKAKLKDAPDLPEINVDHALRGAIDKSGLSPTMVGDAGAAAQRMYDYLDEVIKRNTVNGTIPAEKVLDIRRQLDDWLEANGVKWAADTDAGKGLNIAKREIRTTLNRLVDSADPAAGTAADLARMSELLSARDIITPRMYAEAGTRPGRALQNLERSTGIKHPTTPMALGATGADWKAGLVTGAAALGSGASRSLHKASRTGDAIVMEALADAIRYGAPGAQRAAVLAAINSRKEEGEQ